MDTSTPEVEAPPSKPPFRLAGPPRRRNHWIGMAGGFLIAISVVLPFFSATGASYNLLALHDGLVPVILILGLAAGLLAQFGHTSSLPIFAAVAGMLGFYYFDARCVLLPNGRVMIELKRVEGAIVLQTTAFWLVLAAGVLVTFIADFTDPQRRTRGKKNRPTTIAASTLPATSAPATDPPRPTTLPPRPRR